MTKHRRIQGYTRMCEAYGVLQFSTCWNISQRWLSNAKSIEHINQFLPHQMTNCEVSPWWWISLSYFFFQCRQNCCLSPLSGKVKTFLLGIVMCSQASVEVLSHRGGTGGNEEWISVNIIPPDSFVCCCFLWRLHIFWQKSMHWKWGSFPRRKKMIKSVVLMSHWKASGEI